MSLLGCKTFREVAERKGLHPPIYETTHDVFPAVDVLAATEQTGDRVLFLVRQNRMDRGTAEELIERLIACFAAPRDNANELAAIRQELRRYDE